MTSEKGEPGRRGDRAASPSPGVSTTRVLPAPDGRTRPFWDAAREHRLVVAQCKNCKTARYLPPPLVCPRCLDPQGEFTWEDVSGRGRIRTWTVMQDTFLPAFRQFVPYVVAIVDLDEGEGLRMVTRLLDGPGAPLRLDAPVRVEFEDVTPEVTLPHFRLA